MLPAEVKTEIGMSEKLYKENTESFEKRVRVRGGGGVDLVTGGRAELQNVKLHTLRILWARNVAHITHTRIVYGFHVRKHKEIIRKT